MRTGIALSALLLIISSCAGTPQQNPIQKTQREYQKILNDSVVVENAPNELAEAKQAVSAAKKSILTSDDQSTINQKTALAEQRIAIARKSADLRAAKQNVQQLSDELAQLKSSIHDAKQKRLKARMASMPLRQRVKYLKNFQVLRVDRGIVLRFRGITFESEKATLKSSAEAPINELTEIMNQYTNRSILIQGYTDNTGSASYNKRLSQQRANVVRQALISRKIDPTRIQTSGMGEENPIANNKTERGRRLNRRVEVIISDENGSMNLGP